MTSSTRPAALLMLIAVALAACTAADSAEPSGMEADLYQPAIEEIADDALLLPAEQPVDTTYVTLTALDGRVLLAVQHSDVNVVMCAAPPCTEGARDIRTVTHDGGDYTIQYAGLGQIPDPEVVISEEVLTYWSEATFVNRRPGWLTMELYPGR